MSIRQRNRKNRENRFIDSQDISGQQQLGKIQSKTDSIFDSYQIKGNFMATEARERKDEEVIMFDDDQDLQEELVVNKEYKQHTKEAVVSKRIEGEEQRQIQGLKESKLIRRGKGRNRRSRKNLLDSDKEEDEIKEDNEVVEKREIYENRGADNNNNKEQVANIVDDDFNDFQAEDQEDSNIMQLITKKKETMYPKNELHSPLHIAFNKIGNDQAEKRRFIYRPLDKDQSTHCFFKRYQSGMSEYFQVLTEDQRPILFCENQRGCIGCNYYMSLTKEMNKNSPSYLGKLRGNAVGTQYHLYDFGEQPDSDLDRSKWRTSMGFIEYESNFLGMNGPRKFKVALPNLSLQDNNVFKLASEESLTSISPPLVCKYRNKQPRWSQRLKSFSLNFGGRVKAASIKNFILVDDSCNIDEELEAPNIIVFGKINDNTFSLEYRHPLNLFQAFGVAISEFDFKIVCE